MIWRAAYLFTCMIVLAAITHITVVLLVPTFGTKDAFALLSKTTDLFSFEQISSSGEQLPLSDSDPFFSYGVCRFELSEQGLAVSGPKIDTFWSATIVNEDGTVVYSLNNRTAIDQKLDLILLNPVQILRLRELQPPEVETAIIVEANINGGFVLLRVLTPDVSWISSAKRFLDSISCNAYLPSETPKQTDDATPAS
jgi:uncharacterized membrane protein